MVCVFYGHRECGEEIVPRLETVLKALIEEKGADRFYVGTQGGFDDAVYRTLKTMRRHYPQSSTNGCWRICRLHWSRGTRPSRRTH